MLRHKIMKSLSVCTLAMTLLLQTACSNTSANNNLTAIDEAAKSAASAKNTVESSEPSTSNSDKSKMTLLEALKLKTAKGADFDKSELSGRSVFVVFWTTWCKFCKQELTTLNTIAAELPNNDKLQFLLVNVLGGEESVEKAEKYLTDNNINLPVAFMSQEDSSNLGIPGFPFNFILDKEGNMTELKFDKGKTTYFFGASEEQLRNCVKQVVEG